MARRSRIGAVRRIRRGAETLRRPGSLLLSLCLIGTLLALAPAAQAASAQLAITLFQDLDTRGDTYGPGGPTNIVRSGPNLFFQAQDSTGDTELYVSNGEPGSARKIDVWPGEGYEASSDPVEFIPIGASSILFIAQNGADGYPAYDTRGRRLFISDGTTAGTHPVVPPGAVAGAAAGFYGVDSVGMLLTDTATKGAVFGARAYWSGAFQTDVIPWRIADDGTVTELTLGFDYGDAFGGPVMVGQMLAAVGDVVYADLYDCFACEGNVGHELFRANLAAASPTWDLVADLSPGPDSTGFFARTDVVGSDLYFKTRPYGDSYGSIYRTSGTGATLVAGDPTGKRLSLGISYDGGWYYFRGNELWREGGDGPLATCGNFGPLDVFEGTLPFAVLDGILYFPCGQSTTPSGTYALPYNGLYSYADGVGLQKVFDPVPAAADPYATALFIDGVREFGGALYFSAFDPASNFQSLEVFSYDGTGSPERFKINPSGSTRPRQVLIAGDRLLVWADDGVHGLEPWVARIITQTLTVAVSGDGSVTSDDGGISCTGAGGDCSEGYPGATTVTLTASPGDSSEFSGWSSNCLATTATTCTATLSRSSTVSAFFKAATDGFALAAGGPESVGAGSLTPYTVTVRNFGGSDLVGALVTVTTPLASATDGCTGTAGGPYSCALPTIPAGGDRRFTYYAVAPTAFPSNADAAFALDLSGTGASDGVLTNNTASVSVPVVRDLLSLKIATFPTESSSGGPLSYSLTLRNGSTTTPATGVVLHAGFDATGISLVPSAGCTFDDVPAPPALSSVSCPLASIAAAAVVPVAFQVYAPTLASTDATLDLRVKFWVSYTEILDTDTRNDIDGPVSTAIAPPVAAAADVSTQGRVAPPPTLQQSVEAPADAATGLSTLSAAGLDASDPTATGVVLPSGFVGSVSVVEETELPTVLAADSPVALRVQRFFTEAAPAPQEFPCTATPTYAADCLVFGVSIDRQLETRYVYELTFRFSRSAFLSGSRALAIHRAEIFHDADEDGIYEQLVSSCRGRVSITSYSGSGPCLDRVYIDRPTGDYVFVVVTDTNGRWKIGR